MARSSAQYNGTRDQVKAGTTFAPCDYWGNHHAKDCTWQYGGLSHPISTSSKAPTSGRSRAVEWQQPETPAIRPGDEVAY
jgi:hypothetical protein